MKKKEHVLDYWEELGLERDPVKIDLFFQAWAKRDRKKYGRTCTEAFEELFSGYESALEAILAAFDPEALEKYRSLEPAA
jgi:hypothetical protein